MSMSNILQGISLRNYKFIDWYRQGSDRYCDRAIYWDNFIKLMYHLTQSMYGDVETLA